MNTHKLEQQKSILRNQLRRRIKKIRPQARKRKSRRIIKKVMRTLSFQKAKHLLTYAAVRGEVETRELIRIALRLQKKVYLPRMNPRKKTISIFRIDHWGRGLRRGSYGILEPKPVRSRRGNPAKLDLILVPGLGFDRRGGRLGRGAGYFDRFLSKAKRAQKIGLCFREQLVKKIPAAAHDVLMNKVFTD